MKNKYAIRSKISEAKIRQIVRLFAVDLDALRDPPPEKYAIEKLVFLT